MNVYHIKENKPVALPKSDWGAFFSDDLYAIDLQASSHRYLLLWMGPRLSPEAYAETAHPLDLLTNYENSNLITRTRILRGHEDESLLSLFPEGFVAFIGSRVPLEDKVKEIIEKGAMFRVQAPYGEAARASQ